MKTVKRALILVLVVVMTAALIAGCASSSKSSSSGASAAGSGQLKGKDVSTQTIKLAFLPISTAGITNQMYNIAIAECLSMYPNITLKVFDGQFNVTTINSNIQECITQGYDAIILEPLDTEASNSAVTDAEKAGVPVLTINGGNPSAVHSFHLQGADYEMGQQGAKCLAEACGNKGNVIILDAPAASVAAARMGTGAQDYFQKSTGMKIIDHQFIDKWATDISMTTMSNLLTKYPDIQAVYCASDDIALGACQAIDAANRTNDGIKVWGGTGYPSAFQAIKDGRMYGTSWCDTYSEMSTVIYSALYLIDAGITSYKIGLKETPCVKQDMIAVTKDNVDAIMQISRWNYKSAYIKQ